MPNAWSIGTSNAGISVGVTVWPSSSSSRAAPSTAATQSACAARPSRRRVRNPIRKRPTGAPTSSTYGRAGGGAVYGSPGPMPATASSTRRGVAHGARQHELVGQRAPVLAEVGPERRAGARRLQPDDAAHRRGEADRAAHVVAVRDRHEPGRDRRRRPAARAAGAARRGPTDCASRRTRAVRSCSSSRARACSSCRRTRTPRRGSAPRATCRRVRSSARP